MVSNTLFCGVEHCSVVQLSVGSSGLPTVGGRDTQRVEKLKEGEVKTKPSEQILMEHAVLVCVSVGGVSLTEGEAWTDRCRKVGCR